MAIETRLIEGIAAHLAANSIGAYSKTVAYTPTQVGIYDGQIGTATQEGIGLATYPVADNVDSESVVGLQVTFRSATKATLRDRAEATFDLLHAKWGLTFPAPNSLRVTHMLRRSSADLGRDDLGRWIRTDN